MPSRSSRTPAPSSVLGRLLQFLGLSALAGLLVAALLLPTAGITGAVFASGKEMLDELPDELPSEPIAVPSKIVSADGETIATFYAENRTPVPFDQISDPMKHAMVSIEDARFYQHEGVDAKGLVRAFVNNATSDSTQGASTLTQQFVNNMLVNAQQVRGDSRLTVSGTKNLSDKAKEIKLAVAVEKQMTKDEILNGYLNLVLFQGRAYGVEAAAQYVFGKHASELESWEAATLAGMVQSPTRYNPVRNPEGTTARRDTVLRDMFKYGYLTQEELDHALAQPLKVVMKGTSTGCLSAEFGSYFCDYVERQILANPAFGEDAADRQALLDRGGLTIRTTIDSGLQKKAEEIARRSVPNDESAGAGQTILSLEPGTGNIVSMAQNTEYAIQDSQGRTSLNLNVDNQWGGGNGFQGGSTLKPFTALAWLEAGNHLVDSVDGGDNYYPVGTRFAASCMPQGFVELKTPWGPINNVVDGLLKRDRVDEGLFWSANTPMIATAYQLDLCDITSILTQLGVRHAADGTPISPKDPSFLLGAETISPLALAGAFNALAANGRYCEPRAILEVTDTVGNQYDVGEPTCTQVIDPKYLAELTPVLRHIAANNVTSEGTGYEYAGKTGTNNNSSSTWFVGYTTKLTTAVWTGRYTSLKTLQGETIAGVKYDEFFGTTLNGPSWLEYNAAAKEKEQFVPGELPDYDGPQSEDPGAEGDHPDGTYFPSSAIDRGGEEPRPARPEEY